MNKVFKTVWNASLGVWVAVSETSTGQKKSSHKMKKAAVNTVAAVVIGTATQATTAGWAPTELATTDLSTLLGNIDGTDTIAIGSNTTDGKAQASGSRAIAIGKSSKAIATDTLSIGAGAQATGPRSSSIGTAANASATDTIAIGANATAGDGAGNGSGQGAIALGASATAAKQGAIAIGKGTSVLEENAIAIGAGAFSGKSAVSVGVGSSAAAGAVAINGRATGDNAVSIGIDSEAKYAQAVAVGYKSKAAASAVGIGNEAFAYAEDSIAIGRASTVNPSSGVGSVAIGQDNTLSVKDTFVLGSNTNPGIGNSVVLGAQSTLDTVHTEVKNSTVTYTKADGSTADRIYTFDYAGTPAVANGAVSIGSKGAERQIQHVAAGRVSSVSTDAINGSQLHAVLSEVNRVEQESGWHLDGKDSSGTTVKEKITNDKTVQFAAASNNVTVVAEKTAYGAKLAIDLANQLDLTSAGSVKMGDTLVNTSGLSIGGSNPIVIQQGNINLGGHQVNNIAAGIAGTDAVNVDQLNSSKYAGWNAATEDGNNTLIGSNATVNFKGDSNIQLKQNQMQNAAGEIIGTELAVELAKDLDLTKDGSVKLGDTSLTGGGLIIGVGTTGAGPVIIQQGNISFGGNQLKNVAAGTDATDAVNYQQLKDSLDGVGQWTLTGKDTQGGIVTETIKNSTVAFSSGKNINVTTTKTTNGVDVNVALAKDLDITDGSLKAGNIVINKDGINVGGTTINQVGPATEDHQAVNLAQLKANSYTGWNIKGKDAAGNDVSNLVKKNDTVEFAAGKNINVITGNTTNGSQVTVELAKDLDITDGSLKAGDVVINKGGINAGGNKITNVADGIIGKDSKDAVNGGQIYDLIGGGLGSWDIVGTDTTGNPVDQTISTGSKVEFKAGSKNLVVNTDLVTQGATVSVDLAKDLSVDSILVGGTVNINKDGINAGNTVIKNVAAGKAPTDAVNVSQLDKTNTTVTNYFGGGSGYDPNTQDFTPPTYNVGGGSYNNVGDALDAIDNSVKNTYNYIDKVKNEMNAGIASAMAMEAAPFIAGKYTYAAGTAYHGGEGALGLTLRKTSDNGRWSLTGGVAAGTEGDPSVRVGISGIID